MDSGHPNGPEDRDRPDHPDHDLTDAEAFLAEEAPHGQLGFHAPSVPDARTPAPPPSKNTVDHEAFDERLYREIFEASEELASLPSHEAAPGTMDELLQDFFYAFFKVKPKFLDPEDLSPEHARVNLPFVEKLLEDERTAILRLSTAMDDMASALGTLEAGRNAIEEIQSRPDLCAWINPPPPEDPDEAQEEDREEPSAEPPPEPPQRDVRRLLRQSLEAAQKAVDGYAEALGGWGLSPGDLQRVPLAERLEIARRLRSPRLADFAALLGKMRNAAASASATGLTSGTDEVHSITTGGPIHRVLPQEFVTGLASGDPTLEANFYRKMAEGSLLAYDLTEPERKAYGPIVAMVDSSPSMSGAPMDWASALAAALAQGPAAKEGRPVHLIYFNTRVVKEVELAPYEKDPQKLLELATVGTSGGTDFDAPIKRALEIISASSAGAETREEYSEADLILVTDGQCRLSESGTRALARANEEKDLSLYAVLCGPSASAADVGRYAAAVYHAERDLTSSPEGGRIAADIFRNF